LSTSAVAVIRFHPVNFTGASCDAGHIGRAELRRGLNQRVQNRLQVEVGEQRNLFIGKGASQAVIAIENARLLNELTQSA
jgi:hypothetical protein